MAWCKNPWTDEELALVRKLRAEGLFASQIAKRMKGRTRNAILGKLHRSGAPPLRQDERLFRVRQAAKLRPPRSKAQACAAANARWRKDRPLPAKRPVKVNPNDAASRIAQALLARAYKAEQSRQGWRERHAY